MGEKYRMSLLLVAGMLTAFVLLMVVLRACLQEAGEEGSGEALLSSETSGALPEGKEGSSQGSAKSQETAGLSSDTTAQGKKPAQSTDEPATGGSSGAAGDTVRFRGDLTAEVYELLAIEYTNNTNPDSPHCILTPDSLWQLDDICAQWEAGLISDEQTKVRLELLTLDSGRSPAQLPVYMKYTSVKRYELAETEPEAVSERLMQLNIYPRHYLFLRIYDAPGGGCLVHMVNGLIW